MIKIEDISRFIVLPPEIREISHHEVAPILGLSLKHSDRYLELLEQALRFNRTFHNIGFLCKHMIEEYHMWKFPKSDVLHGLDSGPFNVNVDDAGIHYGVVPLNLVTRIDWDGINQEDNCLIFRMFHNSRLSPGRNDEERILIIYSPEIVTTESTDPCFPNMGTLDSEGSLKTYGIPRRFYKEKEHNGAFT